MPETLTVERGGRRLTGYPALVVDGDSVALRLYDTREAAEAATRIAVVRLIRRQLKDALQRWEKNPPGFAAAALQLKTAIPTDTLLADVLAAVSDRAFIGEDPLPRSERAFAEQVKRARTRLPAVVEGAFRMLAAIAADYHTLSQRLAALSPSQARLGADVRAQRAALVYPGFFSATPWTQLSSSAAISAGAGQETRQSRGRSGPGHKTRANGRRALGALPGAGRGQSGRTARRAGARGVSLAGGGIESFALCPGASHAFPGVIQTSGKGLGGAYSSIDGVFLHWRP